MNIIKCRQYVLVYSVYSILSCSVECKFFALVIQGHLPPPGQVIYHKVSCWLRRYEGQAMFPVEGDGFSRRQLRGSCMTTNSMVLVIMFCWTPGCATCVLLTHYIHTTYMLLIHYAHYLYATHALLEWYSSAIYMLLTHYLHTNNFVSVLIVYILLI